MLLVSLVKFPVEEKKPLSLSTYKKSYSEGIKFVFGQKTIFVFIITMAALNFLLTPLNAFMPAYVEKVMKLGPEGISYMMVSFSTGGILGGFLAGLTGGKLGVKKLVFLGLFFAGLFYSMLGLPAYLNAMNNPLILSAFAALIGMMVPFATAGLGTFIMTITPKEMLSRMGATLNMFAQIASPLGAVVSGFIVVFIPISVILFFAGVAFMVISFAPLKALIDYDKKQNIGKAS
jgi:MFS family permease